MQDLFGSVRRSFSLRSNPAGNDGGGGGGPGSRIVERIGSRLRKSKVGLGLGLGLSPKLSASPNAPPEETNDDASPIRWRKGELIGCGAFGHVYMGMNLDSGELLAVKQVLLGTSNASKEKTQAHIRELEEEVKLLKNLSHPNIVRYLGCGEKANQKLFAGSWLTPSRYLPLALHPDLRSRQSSLSPPSHSRCRLLAVSSPSRSCHEIKSSRDEKLSTRKTCISIAGLAELHIIPPRLPDLFG